MKKNLGIYIIHSNDLEMRKPFCEQLINELKKTFEVQYKYITEFETSEIDNNNVKQYVDLTKTENKDIFDVLSKNIHIRNLSNTLKHFTAMKCVHESDDDYSIVIEDDVLFSKNVNERLLETIKEIKKLDSWHILMTGVPTPSQFTSDKNIINVSEIFKVLPVCDSYFVNRKTVGELIKTFLPIKYITNIHLSYLYTHKEITVLMTTSPIFVDGSKYGLFLSSLETNNKLFLNNEYNNLSTSLKQYEADPSNVNKQRFQDIASKIQMKNHPDIMYIIALFELYNKNYEKCKEYFESIYTLLNNNKSIINLESEFLYKYCNLFSFIQDV